MNENFRDKNSHGATETQSVAGRQSDKLPNQTTPEKNVLEQEQKMSFDAPRFRASARKNWKRVKLGEVCAVKKGHQKNLSEQIPNGEFYILNGGIEPSGRTNSWNTPQNTVTISEGGNSCGFVRFNTEKFWCSGHCYALLIQQDNLLPLFLFYSLKSQESEIMKMRKGSALPNIRLIDIENILIPLPPLEEQRRIAGTLDKVRGLIDLRERELAKFDELVKCRFIEMFGDPVINPKGWEIEKIGELCEIVSGSTPRTEKEEYWGGKNLWITPAEISENDFIISHTERTLSDLGVRSAALRLLPAGTVLLSSRAPIGKIAISGTEMYCNQGFKNLICGTRIRNIFMWAFLRERKDFLVSLGRGATFKEISKTIVENISVPVPPLSLQEEFARFVEAVDKSKFSVVRWISWAERLVIRSVLLKFGA